MTPSAGCEEIRSHIHKDGFEEKSTKDIADLIKDEFTSGLELLTGLELQ